MTEVSLSGNQGGDFWWHEPFERSWRRWWNVGDVYA